MAPLNHRDKVNFLSPQMAEIFIPALATMGTACSILNPHWVEMISEHLS